MTLLKWFVTLTVIIIIQGCASKFPAKVDSSQNKITRCPDVYIVEKGDTIFSLSLKCGFDYKRVALANNIKKPYKISQGEEIRFDLLRENSTSSKNNSDQEVQINTLDDSSSNKVSEKIVTQSDIGEPIEINEPIASREPYNKNSIKKTKEVVAKNTQALSNQYIWPTEGDVTQAFNPEAGKKGISIQGMLGQEVKSIAKGRVIYAGEDLKGYGKLIIIKHDDNVLSVYGHNRELLVIEGQKISAGEIISTMGQTDANEVMLHFEVRKNGLSVDPMSYFKNKS